MRTTLNLDDDILRIARSVATAEHSSLGKVISDLARRGLQDWPGRVGQEDGFPVFLVPEGAPPITDEMVLTALDEP